MGIAALLAAQTLSCVSCVVVAEEELPLIT
jgi:hypothetical protein